jgi:hypothetical protein
LDDDGDNTTFEVIKSSLSIGTFGSVISLLAATYYQEYCTVYSGKCAIIVPVVIFRYIIGDYTYADLFMSIFKNL